LIWSFPITVVEVDEAKTYRILDGLTYKCPLTDRCYLAPSVGVTIFPDLGGGGMLYSASLTSTNSKKQESFRWGFGNMLENYKTESIEVDGVDINADIQKQVLQNGLFFSKPHKFFGGKAESEFYIYDTRYFGDKLYIDQYRGMGLSIGSNSDSKGLTKAIRIGVSYFFSDKSNGYVINFDFKF